MNQPRFNLHFDPDVFAGGIESAHHVELQSFKDLHFQIVGVGTPFDSLGFQQFKGLLDGGISIKIRGQSFG